MGDDNIYLSNLTPEIGTTIVGDTPIAPSFPTDDLKADGEPYVPFDPTKANTFDGIIEPVGPEISPFSSFLEDTWNSDAVKFARDQINQTQQSISLGIGKLKADYSSLSDKQQSMVKSAAGVVAGAAVIGQITKMRSKKSL